MKWVICQNKGQKLAAISFNHCYSDWVGRGGRDDLCHSHVFFTVNSSYSLKDDVQ